MIHANDWQTGLVPAYLKIEYRSVPRYQQIATLFTIHNMAYQGQFWHWDMLLTGLDWKYFNWHQMEFYGKLNLLKTGLVFADSITTVSPRYAQEIQTAPLGCGLEGVLQHRADVLARHPQRHRLRRVEPGHRCASAGRATTPTRSPRASRSARRRLQEELGLPQRPDVPLVGFIGRLVEQKGIDLVAEVMQQWVQTSDVQWVVLGTGEPKYHRLFERLAERFPQKVAVRLEFSNPLAHRIEAGADMFLMPSRFEPCGLNQIYSLKYGTVPVVRATGGLADTITDANDGHAGRGHGQRLQLPGVQPAGVGRNAAPGLDAYRPAGDVGAAGRRPACARTGLGPQRAAVCEAVRGNARPQPPAGGPEAIDARQRERRIEASRLRQERRMPRHARCRLIRPVHGSLSDARSRRIDYARSLVGVFLAPASALLSRRRRPAKTPCLGSACTAPRTTGAWRCCCRKCPRCRPRSTWCPAS